MNNGFMKVAVTGANGQLGLDLCTAFLDNGDQVIRLTHEQMDIADLTATKASLLKHQPDLVINTAAMHNVEACEEDPAQAFAVNGIGARNLALLSESAGFTLMHISTDYVFDGAKQAPYLENDLPIPLNVYGNTKLSGELFVQTIAQKHFILRVSGLYGHNRCRAKGGLNFVSLMRKLASERDEVRVVNDEFVSPTFTEDLASQVVHMSRSTEYGLYHATAEGDCSWYEFAAKIFELTGASIKLSAAAPGEFPAKVPRPNYSVLENGGLKAKGLNIMSHWQEGLQKYLNQTG